MPHSSGHSCDHSIDIYREATAFSGWMVTVTCVTGHKCHGQQLIQSCHLQKLSSNVLTVNVGCITDTPTILPQHHLSFFVHTSGTARIALPHITLLVLNVVFTFNYIPKLSYIWTLHHLEPFPVDASPNTSPPCMLSGLLLFPRLESYIIPCFIPILLAPSFVSLAPTTVSTGSLGQIAIVNVIPTRVGGFVDLLTQASDFLSQTRMEGVVRANQRSRVT